MASTSARDAGMVGNRTTLPRGIVGHLARLRPGRCSNVNKCIGCVSGCIQQRSTRPPHKTLLPTELSPTHPRHQL
eukprot:1721637-Lingulodinium_polyedra.AAC.1